MSSAFVIVVGCFLVLSVLADMVNTLVTTTTSSRPWWLTSILYRRTWLVLRSIALRVERDTVRDALLATYAPVSVLLLLVTWVTQQIVGFGLIWWGIGGIEGADGLVDAVYYSGVVYFTLGFGEVVPTGALPRFGALIEALLGVVTMALVIGYLPALYSAYSERERKLMTLDDGTEHRITPTNLLLSRAPSGDVEEVVRFFEGWEEWVAAVIETHTTFPMLRLFRSKHPGQHWVTAIGVLCDAALQCQIMVDARDRAPYWMLRRSILLFNELTKGVDLSAYRAELDATYAADQEATDGMLLFRQLYDRLEANGYRMVEFDQARADSLALRRLYDAQMEYLIDAILAPRGFWGHAIGHHIGSMDGREEPLPEDGRPHPGEVST